MRKSILLLTLLTITMGLFAENGLPESSNTTASAAKEAVVQDIVINHTMIEKFNNTDFDGNQLDVRSLLEQKTFEEIRSIAHAYKSGEIELLSDATVDEYSKRALSNDSRLILLSEEGLREDK